RDRLSRLVLTVVKVSPRVLCPAFLTIPHPPLSPLFPTRRSSDLCRCRDSERERIDRAEEGHPAELLVGEDRQTERDRHRGRHDRSEEHTSELQSRFELVCRLLLGKKRCDTRSLSAIYYDKRLR